MAGQPFPLIDPNDPDVATKVMWNNVFRPITTDDYDLRFYDCDSAREGRTAVKQIEYFQIGHYAGYDLVGRTEVEPLPVDPDFKTTHRLWLFALYPLLAPQDIRGTGFIRWRYADPNRGDDDWCARRGQRRVRRFNESMMSSATASGTAVTHVNPITIRASTPRPSSTVTTSSAKRTCSHAFMPNIRRRSAARLTAAPAHAPRRGRCAICTSSKRLPRRDRGAAIGALQSRHRLYGQRDVVRALHRYV